MLSKLQLTEKTSSNLHSSKLKVSISDYVNLEYFACFNWLNAKICKINQLMLGVIKKNQIKFLLSSSRYFFKMMKEKRQSITGKTIR